MTSTNNGSRIRCGRRTSPQRSEIKAAAHGGPDTGALPRERRQAHAEVSCKSFAPWYVSDIAQSFTGLDLDCVAASTYTVKDSTVTVDGGEILVRCIIPVGEDDGQTVPVYVNIHGGGETHTHF